MLVPRLLLVLSTCLALPGGEHPEAPDGQRGLGAETPQSELLQLFRSTHDEDRAFLDELRGLAADVRLSLTAVAESYRSRGLLELLGPKVEPTLATFTAAWRDAEKRLLPELAPGGPRARLLARIVVDTRLRVRARLAEGLDVDGREVEAGLAVLRGAAEGQVTLTDDEAHAIAQRVDLAASRLRARQIDLQALRPRASARQAKADEPQVEALLAAARDPDPAVARRGVEAALRRAREQADRMWSALFLARLEEQTAQIAQWRERCLAEAARLREEALVYLPDTEQGKEAPPEIAGLRKHERLRWAGFRARDGLAADPLDDVLAFVAAHAADFQWGSLESVPLYDRFLVLRGIRSYDNRTLTGRELDAWEQEALLAVQHAFERPPQPRRSGGEEDPRGG